jgi:hypothetical protein
MKDESGSHPVAFLNRCSQSQKHLPAAMRGCLRRRRPCWMFSSARQAISAKFAPTMKTRWDRSFPHRAAGPLARLSVRRCRRRGRHGPGRGCLGHGRLGLTEEFAKAPGRHHADQPAAAPHSARQRRGARLHPGPNTGARRWPPRWWPARCATTRRCLACGRLALLPGAQRPGRQITQDHTWVNEQRKMGLISASEMASPTPGTC